MEHIARELKNLKAVIEQCERDNEEPRQHLTGKTTTARRMGDILHKIGLLGSNVVIMKSGLELQGSYVGQTKDKVIDAMNEAQGGILVIDEAYSLASSSPYSQEAIDQLVAMMTQKEHYQNTVVILAGYAEDMERLVTSNDGLRSRFAGRLNFPDWDEEDCVNFIFKEIRRRDQLIADETLIALRENIREIRNRPGWGMQEIVI